MAISNRKIIFQTLCFGSMLSFKRCRRRPVTVDILELQADNTWHISHHQYYHHDSMNMFIVYFYSKFLVVYRMYAIYRSLGFWSGWAAYGTSDLRSSWSKWARCRTGSHILDDVTCFVESSIVLDFQPTSDQQGPKPFSLYLKISFDSLCFCVLPSFLVYSLIFGRILDMSSIWLGKEGPNTAFLAGSFAGRRGGWSWSEGNESQGLDVHGMWVKAVKVFPYVPHSIGKTPLSNSGWFLHVIGNLWHLKFWSTLKSELIVEFTSKICFKNGQMTNNRRVDITNNPTRSKLLQVEFIAVLEIIFPRPRTWGISASVYWLFNHRCWQFLALCQGNHGGF